MSDWLPLAGRLGAWGYGRGPRLVFVHGFTQTSNSWKPIAEGFADGGYECIVVDVPGHGESVDVRVDLPEAADLLTSQCGPAVYIGYSLGGRLCLHAAVAHPQTVRGVAEIGGSPGIADDEQRSARRVADDRLADHIVEAGVGAFLDEWLSLPLFDDLEPDDQQRGDRLRNTPEGLAGSLRLAGSGAQHSLWPRLADLAVPALIIAGERDHKFVEIGKQMAASVCNGKFVEIAGAGHAAHLQQPRLVVAGLKAWLNEISY
ncbi:MAG: alpha/beta fold hydrolase [Ilumatobacteraceae bacterium]